MIDAVLRWQVKKPTPALRNTGAPPGETGDEAGAASGALPDEIGSEGEVLPREVGSKTGTPPSQAGTSTGAACSDQELPSCDGDVDAGEGPSSLMREKPIPNQEGDQVEKHDGEQTGKVKRGLGGSAATASSARPGSDSHSRARCAGQAARRCCGQVYRSV